MSAHSVNQPQIIPHPPLSQTHSFALTGAGASVSPTGREKGEATQGRQLTIVLRRDLLQGSQGECHFSWKVARPVTGTGNW